MNVTCSYCGVVSLKSTMVVSRFTGRAWCIDQDKCRGRVAKKVSQQRREQRAGTTDRSTA